MGELSNHRNEGEHVKTYDGFRLNTLTRYIKSPNNNSAHLKGVETRMMRFLIDSGGSENASLVAKSLYGIDGDDEIKAVYGNFNRINKRMKGDYVKRDSHGNFTITNTNI